MSVVLTIILAIIVSLVMVAVPVMPAMFSADVMAVNPCLVVVGPMAADPNHFIFACPIASAMAVIRPVAYLNAKALRSRGGRK
jgi:type III secretory pathway component EscT